MEGEQEMIEKAIKEESKAFDEEMLKVLDGIA